MISPRGKKTLPSAMSVPKMISRPSLRNRASHAGSPATSAMARSTSGRAVRTNPPTTGPTNVREPPMRTKARRLTLASNVPWRAFQVLRKWALIAPTTPASMAPIVKASVL